MTILIGFMLLRIVFRSKKVRVLSYTVLMSLSEFEWVQLYTREGAGDCSSCVAVMIELVRGISQWAHGFKNAVIFLFNTGEEEGLNGAHSFITQVILMLIVWQCSSLLAMCNLNLSMKHLLAMNCFLLTSVSFSSIIFFVIITLYFYAASLEQYNPHGHWFGGYGNRRKIHYFPGFVFLVILVLIHTYAVKLEFCWHPILNYSTKSIHLQSFFALFPQN